MKQVKSIAIFVFLILLSSCKEEIFLNEIDSDIKITMQESMESGKRALQFCCETDTAYPCFNYKIIHSVKRSSNTINIVFEGIYFSTICADAFGPATATIDLGSLPTGDYKLNLKVGKKSSNAILGVSPEMYSVSFSSLEQIQFTDTHLNRITEPIKNK